METTGEFVQRAQVVSLGRLGELEVPTQRSTTTTRGQSGPRFTPLQSTKVRRVLPANWSRREDGSSGCCSLLGGASFWSTKPNPTAPSIKSIFTQVAWLCTVQKQMGKQDFHAGVFEWVLKNIFHFCLSKSVSQQRDFGSLVKLETRAQMSSYMSWTDELTFDHLST